MKAVILAGGHGTRLSEETQVRPKPMVEIGNKPILWHIMKIYSHHGINDFIICCGYKGEVIKEFFANFQIILLALRISFLGGILHAIFYIKHYFSAIYLFLWKFSGKKKRCIHGQPGRKGVEKPLGLCPPWVLYTRATSSWCVVHARKTNW